MLVYFWHCPPLPQRPSNASAVSGASLLWTEQQHSCFKENYRDLQQQKAECRVQQRPTGQPRPPERSGWEKLTAPVLSTLHPLQNLEVSQHSLILLPAKKIEHLLNSAGLGRGSASGHLHRTGQRSPACSLPHMDAKFTPLQGIHHEDHPYGISVG